MSKMILYVAIPVYAILGTLMFSDGAVLDGFLMWMWSAWFAFMAVKMCD